MRLQEKNDNNVNDDYYNRYLNELHKIYEEDKVRANRMAKRRLVELGFIKENRKENSNNFNFEFDIKFKTIVVICVLIAMVSLIPANGITVPIYLFGFVFFLAGLFVGLYVPFFGIIFLFSHGGTGLFLMLSSLLGSSTENMSIGIDFANNPVFSDGGIPSNIKLYFYFIIVIFVVAFIYTIIHNVSKKMKSDKKHVIIILTLYLIAILLVALSTKIFPVLKY
ncbi:MAG: hypothetical protein IJ568_02035 [Bacilli bacterium]|nr:hypothetical protein [Bacilli bacterium]